MVLHALSPPVWEAHPADAEQTSVLLQADAVCAAQKCLAEGPCPSIASLRERIGLIYLDPPFCTGKAFMYRARVGEQGYRGQDGARLILPAFCDAPLGDLTAYLRMMRELAERCRELLSPTGFLFLHVDARTSAHLRLLLDDVFGARCFVNEIVWHYKTGGRSTRHFGRKHDTILVYARNAGYRLHMQAVGEPRGADRRNHMKREVDERGNVRFCIRTGGKLYTYDAESLVYPSDVWSDIPHLQQRDPERTGYDTQKPEVLLRRILAAGSLPGEWVADFFVGSGTTAAVAASMGRNFVGGDVSPRALSAARARLLGKTALTLLHAKAAPDTDCFLRVGTRVQDGKFCIFLWQYALRDRQAPPAPPAQVSLEQLGAWNEACYGRAIDGTAEQGVQLVTCAALGVWKAGAFTARDCVLRGLASPMLHPVLSMDLPGDGQVAALLIADAAGNTRIFQMLDAPEL